MFQRCPCMYSSAYFSLVICKYERKLQIICNKIGRLPEKLKDYSVYNHWQISQVCLILCKKFHKFRTYCLFNPVHSCIPANTWYWESLKNCVWWGSRVMAYIPPAHRGARQPKNWRQKRYSHMSPPPLPYPPIYGMYRTCKMKRNPRKIDAGW